ncbi:MAG TPA: type II secretion system protein GspF, partial [Candidatus Atribacteria bacterium]|nr:type II secretion system protein GspF [Candidatus Atribacteria bacterium]
MPVYEYKAINSSGKKVSGLIEADTEAHAKSKLRKDNNYPTQLRLSDKGESDGRNIRRLFGRVRPEEIHIFTRQLATLVDAGLPLLSALDTIGDQAGNSHLTKVIFSIKDSLNEGNSLADSLSEHPRLFSSVYVNMIRAGEASGTLSLVLERLADFGESQQALTSKLRAALIYPFFMGFIGTAILFLLITYIVPNITQVFNDMDRVLPLPTQILLTVSDLLINYWWLLPGVFVVVIFIIKQLLKQKWGRRMGDLVKLKAPIIGSILQKIILARFAATLGSLLRSDVELLSSLQIVKALVNNVHIAEVIETSAEDVRKGASITKALSESPWFPPM